MGLKDFIYKLFNKDNRLRTIFSLIYSLIGIVLIIVAHVLNSKYTAPFFERLESVSILNILFVILAVFILFIFTIGNINTTPDIQEKDLNISLPYKEARNLFKKQFEKHVVNDDSKYHKLLKKDKRIDIINLIVAAIFLLAYIPLLVFQQEIVILIQNWNLAEGDFRFLYVIVIKAVIDVLVFLMVVIRKLDSKKEQQYRLAKLFPAFRELQKENLDILSNKIETKAYPGRGIVFRNENIIDISYYCSPNRTLEEELVLMHELAKFIVLSNRYAKDILFIGLFLSLSFLFSAFLFEDYTVYFILFFGVFLVVTIITGSFSQYREDYTQRAKWILGFELPKEETARQTGVDHPLFDLDDI